MKWISNNRFYDILTFFFFQHSIFHLLFDTFHTVKNIEHICFDWFKSNAFQLIWMCKYAKWIQALQVFFLMHSLTLFANTQFLIFFFFNGFDCNSKRIERSIFYEITELIHYGTKNTSHVWAYTSTFALLCTLAKNPIFSGWMLWFMLNSWQKQKHANTLCLYILCQQNARKFYWFICRENDVRLVGVKVKTNENVT